MLPDPRVSAVAGVTANSPGTEEEAAAVQEAGVEDAETRQAPAQEMVVQRALTRELVMQQTCVPKAFARKAALHAHLDSLLPRFSGIWCSDPVAKDRIFHSIDYVGRAALPGTTSRYEFAEVRRIVEEFVSVNELPHDALIADLGAGDGRITGALRDLGYRNLVALDIDHENAQRLNERFGADTICVDFTTEGLFPDETFDAVIAWGLLTSLQDFRSSLAALVRSLVPGGALMTAEPTLESVLLYTLVRGDLDEFRRTLSTGSRAAMWDDRELRYAVHTTATLREWMYGTDGIEMIAERNVGVFPSLIAGGVLEEKGVSREERSAFLDSIDFAAINSVPRQIAFMARRSR